MNEHIAVPEHTKEIISSVNTEKMRISKDKHDISKLSQNPSQIEAREVIKKLIKGEFDSQSETANIPGNHFQAANSMLGSYSDYSEHGLIGEIIRSRNKIAE